VAAPEVPVVVSVNGTAHIASPRQKVVAEAPVVAEVAQEVVAPPVVKPKKKRKYKPRNPQNKK
jgi:hypothetical protein